MVNAQILLIEDDASLREVTASGLMHAGFGVSSAGDGESGWLRFVGLRPDAVVIDVMLPGMDGFELCRRIRAASSVPIVMLTARSDPVDVVVGLEAGADDYVTKPFDMHVLAARLRAVLRRAGNFDHPEVIRIGSLELDVPSHLVRRNGEEISVSAIEFRLLVELARRPGMVFTREMLLERVWGYDYLGDSRLVDVMIQRLRSKIETDPGSPDLIITVRGVGYKAAR